MARAMSQDMDNQEEEEEDNLLVSDLDGTEDERKEKLEKERANKAMNNFRNKHTSKDEENWKNQNKEQRINNDKEESNGKTKTKKSRDKTKANHKGEKTKRGKQKKKKDDQIFKAKTELLGQKRNNPFGSFDFSVRENKEQNQYNSLNLDKENYSRKSTESDTISFGPDYKCPSLEESSEYFNEISCLFFAVKRQEPNKSLFQQKDASGNAKNLASVFNRSENGEEEKIFSLDKNYSGEEPRINGSNFNDPSLSNDSS